MAVVVIMHAWDLRFPAGWFGDGCFITCQVKSTSTCAVHSKRVEAALAVEEAGSVALYKK